MDPTDFKNYNYQKLRLDARRDDPVLRAALKDGWVVEEDEEYARFKTPEDADPICILTFSRKKAL